ncbi:hypothetical protein FB451DRAFT_1379703 [Mycena latifolia]|nr:hypothetical protein FB451DRAFT_1379703 [Mycena latifolia]
MPGPCPPSTDRQTGCALAVRCVRPECSIVQSPSIPEPEPIPLRTSTLGLGLLFACVLYTLRLFPSLLCMRRPAVRHARKPGRELLWIWTPTNSGHPPISNTRAVVPSRSRLRCLASTQAWPRADDEALPRRADEALRRRHGAWAPSKVEGQMRMLLRCPSPLALPYSSLVFLLVSQQPTTVLPCARPACLDTALPCITHHSSRPSAFVFVRVAFHRARKNQSINLRPVSPRLASGSQHVVFRPPLAYRRAHPHRPTPVRRQRRKEGRSSTLNATRLCPR